MQETKITKVWEIDVCVTGIAKRDRKVKRHSAMIATAHDDGTDASKPTLGGLDIQVLVKKWIEKHIKQVDKALVVACPVTYKTYAGPASSLDPGPYTLQERMLFNPRQFSHEVIL
jgi:hypothetical protein